MRRTLAQAIARGLAASLVAAHLACGASGPDRARVVLVTTTSVEASGLLEELVDGYHRAQDRYRLAPAAVGSGAALEIGRRGDADLLLTHDPEGERAFAADGFAIAQGPVMMNEFVLVGPVDDPARIAQARVTGSATASAAAFRRLADQRARFVSRGDDSGTHARERRLWEAVTLRPWIDRPAWYVEAGTGMAETLQMASQMGAYTLTDRGTFLHLRERLQLRVLVEGSPPLENHYTYTLPRGVRNRAGARHFLAWLTGPGQDVIGTYGAAEFGRPLFRPTAR